MCGLRERELEREREERTRVERVASGGRERSKKGEKKSDTCSEPYGLETTGRYRIEPNRGKEEDGNTKQGEREIKDQK